MKNIDINEWLLNNGIEPLCEIVNKEKEVMYLSDLLEKHLQEQLALCSVVECKHDFKPYYNWCGELDGYKCEKCGEEKD